VEIIVAAPTPAAVAARNATATIPQSLLLRADEVIQ